MIVMLAPGAEGWDMGGPGALVSLFDKKVQIKGLELENSNCLNADATCLPFKDNVLDFIVSFHAIEHFKDVRSAFKEWYRVLKPGGIVGFIMPDFEHFSHYNWEDKNSRFYAPSEMLPEQCLSIIKETKFNILSFNSMDNNFEFEGILKK
jgi:ubiquinone/menaquinone biosynthesis C-methylase UbiE